MEMEIEDSDNNDNNINNNNNNINNNNNNNNNDNNGNILTLSLLIADCCVEYISPLPVVIPREKNVGLLSVFSQDSFAL